MSRRPHKAPLAQYRATRGHSELASAEAALEEIDRLAGEGQGQVVAPALIAKEGVLGVDLVPGVEADRAGARL
jgi:hypothetical protein